MPTHNRLIAIAAIWIALSSASAIHAQEDDPALDKSSLFKTRAALISKENTEQLQLEEAKRRAALAALAPVAVHTPKLDPSPMLLEIGGSDSHLVAVFQYPDGKTFAAGRGELVPHWGRIRNIMPGAVEDGAGHWHDLAAASK